VAVRNVDRLAMLEVANAAQVILTREGRRLLIERVHSLRVEVLPALRAALEDPERDGRVDAEYQQAVDEVHRLTWLVDHAAIAEDQLGEPAVVELGKAVTVRDGRGVVERFLIVHPIEAPLDDLRISVRSPLARRCSVIRSARRWKWLPRQAPTAAGSWRSRALPSVRMRRRRPLDTTQ
jgi:transcription elongation GreA/GreB family factor